MTTNIPPRIGFACKWIDRPDQTDGIGAKDDAKQYNTGGTTMTWLRNNPKLAEQKLWDLMVGNIESTRKLVARVATLPESLRMVRLSSDILGGYTHNDWQHFWQRHDVQSYCEKHFIEIGNIARQHNVRLSFHPGQFTVLASDNEGIVENSIKEFEYHADMARWMGFGAKWQDFKINVHISGRQGPEGIRKAYNRLSPEARNTITIENEEMKYGIESCLTLADTLPIVLDIHHHWVATGEYIDPRDDRCKRVIDSWRGVKPTLHYSCSREDVLVGHSTSAAPNLPVLLEAGFKKQKLRAHSDFYWNTVTNEWALSFLDNFDIMCESKGKNLASRALYEQWKK